MTTIWLHDHRAGQWLDVPWTLAQQAPPFSYDVLKAAQAALAQRDQNNVGDVLASIYRIQTDGARTTREKQAPAGQQPPNRSCPTSPSCPTTKTNRNPPHRISRPPTAVLRRLLPRVPAVSVASARRP